MFNEISSEHMLYALCVQVMEGRGKMLVTAVGPNSQQGIIFQLMIQREEEAGIT